MSRQVKKPGVSPPSVKLVQQALERLHGAGVRVRLDDKGVGFRMWDGEKRVPWAEELNEPSRILAEAYHATGAEGQVWYYNSLGYDVEWADMSSAGAITLVLIDRRGPEWQESGPVITVTIDAHYPV